MDSKKPVALFLNGDYKKEIFYKEIVKNYEYIVCVDGAGNILYKLNIIPSVIIGDQDSINKEILEYFSEGNSLIVTSLSLKYSKRTRLQKN